MSKNTELLLKLLNDKPLIVFDSKTFPSEEKIYTLAGMKRFFNKNDLNNAKLDEAFNELQNDKTTSLKSIKVYNHSYKEKFPYFYIGIEDHELENIRLKLESDSLLLKKSEKVITSKIDNPKEKIKRKKK